MEYGEILATLLAIVLVVVKGMDWYIKRKAKQRDIYKALLPKMEEIYSVLNSLLIASGAHRALILSTENGGGVPQVGKPLYSSILYEVKSSYSFPDLKDTWQKQLVDESYVSLLLEVHTRHVASLTTGEMSEGILKDLYISEGIQTSLVFAITVANDRFYYLSLTYKEDTELTPRIRNAVRVATAKLTLVLG